MKKKNLFLEILHELVLDWRSCIFCEHKNMNKAKGISSLDGEEEEEEEDKTLLKKDYENFVNPGAPEEAADHAETGPGGGGVQKGKVSERR